MQFDNIEYFCKKQTKRLSARISLNVTWWLMKRVKQCTRAFRVCSFTARFSLLKGIKNDRKIQDMGAENVYIYVQNKHDYKCDIDFIQQFNKQVNI